MKHFASALALLCLSCATTTPKPPPTATVSAEEMVDHSGDSVQTAIAVPVDAPDGGADFENRWIFQQYGRFRRSGGGTGSVEGRRYNVVKIELANGDRKTVYFDITENWDRWNPQQP